MEAILLGIQGFILLMAIIFGIVIIRSDKKIYADKDFGRPFLYDDHLSEEEMGIQCGEWPYIDMRERSN